MNSIRWVLNDDTGANPHCPACSSFAGEYESYEALMTRTGGALPGYFPGYADLLETEQDDEYQDVDIEGGTEKGFACWSLCQCRLEIMRGGEWQRFDPAARPV